MMPSLIGGGGRAEAVVERRIKVAIAVSHPIQHFCPLYAHLATDHRLAVTVLFGVRTGAAPYVDADFGERIDTGVSAHLATFEHRFLTDSIDLADEAMIERAMVWQALDEIDPDVVVVYGTHQSTSRWAWVWSRIRRRPVAYISDSEDRGDQMRRVSRQLLGAAVMAATTRFFTVGDANREYYRRRCVSTSKMADVPFPIDCISYSSAYADREALREMTRQEFGVGNEVVVMTCGKLIARKRQADLLLAIADLDPTRYVVLLAGSGPDRVDLESLAQHLGVRVIFAGFIAPVDLPRHYLASDIYAHTSGHDPHPLAISEAIYCGLPVVVSDRIGSWGPNDDVQPDHNGIVYPAGDIGRLAEAIGRLEQHEQLRRQYSECSIEISRRRQEMAYDGFAREVINLAST